MLPDIGFSEILVIALVVLLVAKPEDLPATMRRIGIIMAHIRHNVAGMWRGWQQALENPPTESPTQSDKPQ
jgi:Sec-independent protein translocase protein TatA